jgi:AcrR family transcriptional regulator
MYRIQYDCIGAIMNADEYQPSTASEDLTTRARIRTAALAEFAKHGFRGASIRGIARSAGVSPGLVQHHFGTKDALREACDQYVIELITDVQRNAGQGTGPSPEFIAAQLHHIEPLIDYLVMSLSSGSEIANQWFKQITEYTHTSLMSGRIGPPLDPSLDTRAIAAAQAAMSLGIMVFYRNLQNVLETDDPTELMVRIGHARLFLASDRIVGDELRERLGTALNQYADSKTTGKPPPASPDEEE